MFSFVFPYRYLWPIRTNSFGTSFLISANWDEDIGTDEDIGLFFFFDNGGGSYNFLFAQDRVRL